MMGDERSYQGEERRKISECPLTVEQAYQILNRLSQSIEVQTKSVSQQEDILIRLSRLEKYIFAGRAVFWAVATLGAISAWATGLASDIRDFFRR